MPSFTHTHICKLWSVPQSSPSPKCRASSKGWLGSMTPFQSQDHDLPAPLHNPTLMLVWCGAEHNLEELELQWVASRSGIREQDKGQDSGPGRAPGEGRDQLPSGICSWHLSTDDLDSAHCTRAIKAASCSSSLRLNNSTLLTLMCRFYFCDFPRSALKMS